MDDEEPLAGKDSGKQNRHALAVLAARVTVGSKRAATDRLPSLGRNGDVETAAEVRNLADAAMMDRALAEAWR